MGDRIHFYRKTIERLAAGLTNNDDEGRKLTYERVRRANEKFIAENGHRLSNESKENMRQQLEKAINLYETAALAPSASRKLSGADAMNLLIETSPEKLEVVVDKPPRSLRNRHVRASGFLASGFVIAIIVALMMNHLNVWPFGKTSDSELQEKGAMFEAGYRGAMPVVQAQLTLLGRVEQAVIERQQSDHRGLQAAAGQRMTSLEEVFPELASEIGIIADSRLRVFVRATGDAYKILFATPLCTAVRVDRPDIVDIRRTSGGFFCDYYGAWNEMGAKF